MGYGYVVDGGGWKWCCWWSVRSTFLRGDNHSSENVKGGGGGRKGIDNDSDFCCIVSRIQIRFGFKSRRRSSVSFRRGGYIEFIIFSLLLSTTCGMFEYHDKNISREDA